MVHWLGQVYLNPKIAFSLSETTTGNQLTEMSRDVSVFVFALIAQTEFLGISRKFEGGIPDISGECAAKMVRNSKEILIEKKYRTAKRSSTFASSTSLWRLRVAAALLQAG